MSEKSYKETLSLPQTDFPMKANLISKEPELLSFWEKEEIYPKILKERAGSPKFILHDGPPYANGDIHLGHCLNKILKDFVIKSKSMSGYLSEYVPGWDCHGQPIEHKVVDQGLKKQKESLSVMEIRKACYEYAMKYVGIQRDEFKRIGVFGIWDKPYLTLDPAYEAAILRKLGDFAGNGLLYKRKKPVHWCVSCVTALAEAEVEYEDVTSPSIYVKFLLPQNQLNNFRTLKNKNVSVLIWTTTPWTLPANLAISLHPDFNYIAVEEENEVYIIAEGLFESVSKACSWKNPKIIDSFKAEKLNKLKTKHPFIDRDSIILLGKHVTLEQGTGCVHTAPGHGVEDYLMGLEAGLDIYCPVDGGGKFTSDVAQFANQFVFKANPIIVDLLKEKQKLAASTSLSHSYPHCWRCKNKVIFRATEQWFISMEKNDFRKKALKAIDNVQWIPSWGRNRIYGMVENRPDWCISRQRSWGVPIVAFRCKACNELIFSKELIYDIASKIEKEGTDLWFTKSASELIPPGTKCPKCQKTDFEKEEDILDVWFESGVSWAAVLDTRKQLGSPADLYLEGSDQHRGWFQSSLLAGVGTVGHPPFKAVLTHGFTVDEQGRKMSKSLGNVVDAMQFINKNGADLLRLWVSSEDYRNDLACSPNILARIAESYRRIRNTCRFILGNLNDFDPNKDLLPESELEEIDKLALHQLMVVNDKIRAAYEKYDYPVIYHAINNYCTVDLSAFYLDILKDRLYCSAPKDKTRRAAQTTMWHILNITNRLLAPILSFTMEEVWRFFPAKNKEESIHLSQFINPNPKWLNPELEEKWQKISEIRGEVLKALEIARNQKMIGHPLEAEVYLDLPKEFQELPNYWKEVFIVSSVQLKKPPKNSLLLESEKIKNLTIGILPATGEKCERCWMRTTEIGKNKEKDLCNRCADAITRL